MSNTSYYPPFLGVQFRRNNADPKFICQYCHGLVYQPVQMNCCSMLLCKYCVLKASSTNRCQLCQQAISNDDIMLDRGAERDMETIQVECYKCQWNGTFKNYMIHLEATHADYICQQCHQSFVCVNQLHDHLQTSCPEILISCGIEECQSWVRRADLQEHFLTEQHMNAVTRNLANKIDRRKTFQLSQKTEMHQQYLEELQQSLNDSNLLEETHQNLLNEHHSFDESISFLKNDLRKIHEEISKDETCKDQIEKGMNELGTIFKHIEEENIQELIDRTKMDQTRLLDGEGMITLRFESLNPSVSYRFRTSPYGHTFQIRTMIQSDSSSESLSLILSLIPSDYDQILQYPFRYNITLCLYDQSLNRKHIVKEIEANRFSTQLARPSPRECENNLTVPNFCSLSTLISPENSYLRDGAYFIGVFVDFLNTGIHPFV